QNYQTKYSEIDLIVKRDNVLIFVEVRTKRSSAFVSPEESINQKKLKKLYWNAEEYMASKKYKGQSRIDAICIILNSDNTIERLEHYEGI
ncbi:YraN family protein, partial [Patescibacteria group bacterium]|nr:YraN family protein [Patescibacteria group bacterium]